MYVARRNSSQYLQRWAVGLWALLLFTPGASLAAAQPVYKRQVERWGMQEIVLHSSRHYINPFQDVSVSATFSRGDSTVRVAGFYDGNQTWRVRFMPEETGLWHFKSQSADLDLSATGAFTVGRPDPLNHGPVGVSHVHHFSYADGTPLFVLGTTAYNWINRDSTLQEETLRTLAHEPFNKLRFCIFPKWYNYNRVEPKFFPYPRNPDGSFDFDRFDPRYFATLEKRIAELQRLGVEADVILFHPYDHWGFAEMDQVHDDEYLRYVAARLGAFRNIWWTMANEYDLFSPSLVSWGSFTVKARKPKDWDHLGKTLASSDPFHHLLGIHDIATWYDGNTPWLTHVIDQDGTRRPDLAVPVGRALYAKPILVDEYGYEGNNGASWGSLDARTLLQEHWELTVDGGYGSHGETYVHPGGILWWADGGALVGDLPSRLGFLKKIMMEAPFQKLEPDPMRVMGGNALIGPHGYSLFYFEKGGPVQIKLEGSALFKAELIDPWQMKVYPLGIVASGIQKLRMRMVPELLRFTPVAEGNVPSVSLRDRMEKFAGELDSPAPDTAFHPVPPHLSDEYTLNLILLNPAGRETLLRLLPNLKLDGINPALTLRQIAANPQSGIDPKVFEAVKTELATIPAY